jgi:hypothetical protein
MAGLFADAKWRGKGRQQAGEFRPRYPQPRLVAAALRKAGSRPRAARQYRGRGRVSGRGADRQPGDRGTARRSPEHFFEPVHGRIYERILQLLDRKAVVTPVTLKPYFEATRR